MDAGRTNCFIKLDWRRWFILLSVSLIGLLVEIMTVFSGTLSGILAAHFLLNSNQLDWIFASNVGSAIICTLFMGIILRLYPHEVKRWLLASVLGLFVSYVLISISMASKRLFFLIYIAQMLCGAVFTLFVALVSITSVVWFSELEQGTVSGVTYSCFSIGNLLSAVIPLAFLSFDKVQETDHIIHMTQALYVGISVLLFCLACIIWACIPNAPPFAPSCLEHIRRTTVSDETRISLSVATNEYFKELKYLIVNYHSQGLLWTYAISNVLYLVYFIMIPTPGHFAASNSLLSVTEKAYYLCSFAGGGAIGAVFFGYLFDRIKSYRRIACPFAFINLLVGSLQIVAYYYHSDAGLYLLVGIHGMIVMSSLSFTTEVLKQSAYPQAGEGTQAMMTSLLCNMLCLIFIYTYRSCIAAFGEISFYAVTSVMCLFQTTLLIMINPPLNRFEAETISLL